jgi:hypothetical protein
LDSRNAAAPGSTAKTSSQIVEECDALFHPVRPPEEKAEEDRLREAERAKEQLQKNAINSGEEKDTCLAIIRIFKNQAQSDWTQAHRSGPAQTSASNKTASDQSFPNYLSEKSAYIEQSLPPHCRRYWTAN